LPASIPFLFALQDIDLSLDTHRAALEAAEAALEDESTVEEARAEVAEADVARQAGTRGQREREIEVEDMKARLAPLESKLYGGTIKSPKELQELDHQVNTLKEMVAEREAALLEQLTETESAASAYEKATARLAQLEADRAAEVERLRGEISGHQAAVRDLESRREEAAAKVDPQSLRVYSMIRPRTGGRAVARVERGMCGGCRISLPVSVVSRARAGTSLVQCTSCQRILAGF
jgi:predicted  nucleic acid-binding Zn-ribbon protein